MSGRPSRRQKPSCRFCLETRTTKENYLFAPCACRGSVEYIHYACFLRWFFTCDPQVRMICPICKTHYTTTPFDDLEKVSPIAPTPIRIYGNPVVSILLFHYLFAFLGAISVKVNLPVGDIYMGSILCYQIAFFAMLHKYTQPQDFWTYLKVYCSRKNWGLPVIQIAILCFLGYNPSAFFVAGVCANGLLSFYWPLHVETIHECNRLAIEDMAVRLTLMED